MTKSPQIKILEQFLIAAIIGVVFFCIYTLYQRGEFDSILDLRKSKSDTTIIVNAPPKVDPTNAVQKTNTYDSKKEANDKCNCTSQDVEVLVYKIISNYTRDQNELPSDIARIMSEYGAPEKRDNCTWVVTFKISWPYGNTDGAHPDEFVKKHIACDGKEVYVQ